MVDSELPTDRRNRRFRWHHAVLVILLLPIVYLFSYAPYLRFARDPNDYVSRTSEFYRGAEWVFSKSDNFPIFRGWARLFGVEPLMNWHVLGYKHHAYQRQKAESTPPPQE